MRIVFMGTPEFAVPSLNALLDAGYELAGAFTQPDRPAGRGKKLSACPVKRAAEARGVKVFQVEKIRRVEGVEILKSLAPDLCVTAAFGQILSAENLSIPPLGTINVHASLLPRHRGAAPINQAILMGEKQTGVTTMYTDVGLDTGDMIFRERTAIGERETAGELTERLSHMGAALLIKTVRAVERGEAPREKQADSEASYEKMLSKEDGLLDFEKGASALYNRVRGLNPWPGAWARLGDGVLKIWDARALNESASGRPGEILRASAKEGLIVQTGDGLLEITEMQAPNAKRMSAKAYLMGKTIEVGTVLNK